MFFAGRVSWTTGDKTSLPQIDPIAGKLRSQYQGKSRARLWYYQVLGQLVALQVAGRRNIRLSWVNTDLLPDKAGLDTNI